MKKYVFLIIGIVALIVGSVGIVIPILPTTPLLLVATWCFLKSSKRLHNWLINHRILGLYIKSYVKYKGVEKKYKLATILMVWASIGFSISIVDNFYVKVLLAIIMVGVTIHILMLRTLSKEEVIALEEFEKIEKKKIKRKIY